MNGRVTLVAGLACTIVMATTPAAFAMKSRVIVTLTAGTDAQAAADQATANGAEITHVFHAGYSGRLPGKLIKQLRSAPDVSAIERDRRLRAAQVMCATQSQAPWGLDRISERALVLDGDYQSSYDGTPDKAYVLDTGIDTQNPDFGGRATWGVDEIDGSQQDCNGHGTAVAGTVGGTTLGVAKKVPLVAVRVLNCNGVGFASDVIAGLEWVVDDHQANPRPSVAVLALGGKLSNAVNAAVDAATQAGIVTVAAAGNQQADACNFSPASASSVMTAAATDKDIVNHVDVVAPFSNGGTCVTMFAPGVDITVDWLHGRTKNVSGTSFSAAYLAGAAVQTLNAHPTWTADQVKSFLISRSTKGIVTGTSKAPASANQILYTACDV